MLLQLAGAVSALALPVIAQPPLKITSPAGGALFRPGSAFVVTVERAPSVSRQLVLLDIDGTFGNIGDFIQEGPGLTYKFEVKIPPDAAPRIYTLRAVNGFAADDKEAGESPAVKIDIERPDQPASIRANPPFCWFKLGETLELNIEGAFSDGTYVTLSKSTRTTYRSDRPSVAYVTKEGQVIGRHVGRANITVRHGAATTIVDARVESTDEKPPTAPLDVMDMGPSPRKKK
jgi:hypothetical protein